MALRTDKTGFGDIEIVQDDSMFCYGIDAVLLSDFAARRLNERKKAISELCDLGTGNGIIPLILSHKTDIRRIVGVEIQEKCADLAEENARRNGVQDRISFVRCNVKDMGTIEKLLGKKNFSAITMNPPYTEKGRGIAATCNEKNLARHEISASLDDFIACASALLGDRGDFFMIHRPTRLADIFTLLRKQRIEPKEMQLISGRKDETPNLVLLHCVKNGRPELNVLPQIFVREEDGSISEKIREIYEQ